MVKNNTHNSDTEFKIESELFALVKSINNLNNKYQKGIVNENFFRKALKSAMNNFLKLNFLRFENPKYKATANTIPPNGVLPIVANNVNIDIIMFIIYKTFLSSL